MITPVVDNKSTTYFPIPFETINTDNSDNNQRVPSSATNSSDTSVTNFSEILTEKVLSKTLRNSSSDFSADPSDNKLSVMALFLLLSSSLSATKEKKLELLNEFIQYLANYQQYLGDGNGMTDAINLLNEKNQAKEAAQAAANTANQAKEAAQAAANKAADAATLAAEEAKAAAQAAELATEEEKPAAEAAAKKAAEAAELATDKANQAAKLAETATNEANAAAEAVEFASDGVNAAAELVANVINQINVVAQTLRAVTALSTKETNNITNEEKNTLKVLTEIIKSNFRSDEKKGDQRLLNSRLKDLLNDLTRSQQQSYNFSLDEVQGNSQLLNSEQNDLPRSQQSV